ASCRKCVFTHKDRWSSGLREGLRDPVGLGVGDARVDPKRERALEGLVGTRERTLVSVRGQPVERIRADVRLDSRSTKGREHLVAAVDPDYIGLPAVAVALGRLR